MNANYGLFPPLGRPLRGREKKLALAERALAALSALARGSGPRRPRAPPRSRDAAARAARARRRRDRRRQQLGPAAHRRGRRRRARAPASTPRSRRRGWAAGCVAGGSLDPAGSRADARRRRRASRRVRARAARRDVVGVRHRRGAPRARRARLRGGAGAAPPACPVEVLSGDDEAALAYAAVRARPRGERIGRSWPSTSAARTTELTLGRGERDRRDGEPAARRAGADGVARVRRRADAVARALAATGVARRARGRPAAVLVASGGTATALAALDLGPRERTTRSACTVTRSRCDRLAGLARPPRADVPACSTRVARASCPAGALILEVVARAAGAATLRVSEHGVRHAYLRAAAGGGGGRRRPASAVELTAEQLAAAGVPEPARVVVAAARGAGVARAPCRARRRARRARRAPPTRRPRCTRSRGCSPPAPAPRARRRERAAAACSAAARRSPATLAREGAGLARRVRARCSHEDRRDAAAHAPRARRRSASAAPLPRDGAAVACSGATAAASCVRIGGRDLLGLATVDDTVRELSALAEAVIDGGARVRPARGSRPEWGEDPPVAFVVLGMGKLGGERAQLQLRRRPGLRLRARRRAARADAPCASSSSRVGRGGDAGARRGDAGRLLLPRRPAAAAGRRRGSARGVAAGAALATTRRSGQTWERAVWLKARAVGRRPALGEALARRADAVRLPALPRLRDARGPEGDEAARGRVAARPGARASAT